MQIIIGVAPVELAAGPLLSAPAQDCALPPL